MANFPDDLIKAIDEYNYPKGTDWYKFIQTMPPLGVSEDYIQAWMIAILAAIPAPEANPAAKTATPVASTDSKPAA